MKAPGRSLDIYMVDGSPSGIFQVTLDNWNACIFCVPRSALSAGEDLEELHLPGLCILLGQNGESRQFAHICQGDDALSLLEKDFDFEHRDCFWSEAFVITAPDGTLDRSRLTCLEARLVDAALHAGRCILLNSPAADTDSFPRKVRDFADVFFPSVRTALPVLGCRIFEPSPSDTPEAEDSSRLFFLQSSAGNEYLYDAAAMITREGFWVLRGSRVMQVPPDTFEDWLSRESQYTCVGEDGKLTADLLFPGPGPAARFVSGGAVSDPAAWTDMHGTSLFRLSHASPDSPPLLPESSDEPGSAGPLSGLLCLRRDGAAARGMLTPDGFIVLKGSAVAPVSGTGCPSSILGRRFRLVSSGALCGGVFTEDVEFSDPGEAASVILGTDAGPSCWQPETAGPEQVPDSRSTADSSDVQDRPQQIPDAGLSSREPLAGDGTSAEEDGEQPQSAVLPPEPQPPDTVMADPLPTAPAGCELLHIRLSRLRAWGFYDRESGVFTVLKGSQMSETETPTVASHVRAARRRLMEDGSVRDFLFTRDVEFTSPSAAADVVCGSQKDGWLYWLKSDGSTIDSMRRTPAKKAPGRSRGGKRSGKSQNG